MARVLFISNDEHKISTLQAILTKNMLDIEVVCEEGKIFENIQSFFPDLILLDTAFECSDIVVLAKKIKINTQTDNIIFSLIVNSDCDNQDLLKTAFSYIVEPMNEKILVSTIMSNIRMKNSLDVLSKNNADLAKSLYQLDVLYNTSTRFAGSLDREKLVDIMLEGLEKSLSFNMSYILLFNSDDDIKLIINSLHPLSERFEQAVKLRAMISYKSLFDKKQMPYAIKPENINVERRIKHPYVEYDLPVLNYDNMFAPITVGEKFFGVIEVFREEEFKSEDATCFQTLSKQVSIPLETATLYDEIKQTNTKLENLERMKSEFISIVSHELRTPLTAIKNSLGILKGGTAGETTPVMDKFLGLAERNVLRLKGIINDLLDLSKIEAGKMKYTFERADIITPIEAVKNTLENLIKEKNINFSLDIEDSLPLVFIDTLRIEQVVTNLISNAIKFTPENGEIKVSVKLCSGVELNQAELAPDMDYITVSVKDSGIGIEQENLEKVFDKFQQIESSLSRKIGGTGLGLPIAKQLVDAHKGAIWVESVINQGSNFTFAVPVLNDFEIFKSDLEKQLVSAKANNYKLGIVKISEKTQGASFIEDILSGDISIIRKTTNVKDYAMIEGNCKVLYYTVMQMDRYALNFVGKKIDGFINSEPKYKKCDILFSTALYPDDEMTVEALIERLRTNTIEVKS